MVSKARMIWKQVAETKAQAAMAVASLRDASERDISDSRAAEAAAKAEASQVRKDSSAAMEQLRRELRVQLKQAEAMVSKYARLKM